MKYNKNLLTVLLVGSMWGLVEVLPLSTSLYCAAGVFFLALGRRYIPTPGASIAIALIVCVYKTFHASFMVCQWSGVLSLAVSWEILWILFGHRIERRLVGWSLLGAGTCILALPVFTGWITLIVHHPYWLEGGWPRIMDYALNTTGVAAVLSLVTAPVGAAVEQFNKNALARLKPRPAWAFYTATIVACWLYASIA